MAAPKPVIQAMTNADPRFYPVMGPFLARRDIVEELGAPTWDDDGKVWFVAMVRGRVAGFCAATPKDNWVDFGSAYVLPNHRDTGVYHDMFQARLDAYRDQATRVTTRLENQTNYTEWGYVAGKPRGGFITMRREPVEGESPKARAADDDGGGDLISDSIIEGIVTDAQQAYEQLAHLDLDDRIDTINQLRSDLSKHSPMRDEPVDCVQWVRAESLSANDYNPNVVAPPEMRLLQRSIMSDGYTQPIVTWPVEDGYEIVDGFHRHRVGREVKAVGSRVHGRLPVTIIRPERYDKADRMAATIRHNRARGVHTVDGMSDIVLELARRGKTDVQIGAELGMEPDEVLRLKQIQGLAELFADEEFSEAWEPDTDVFAT